MIVFVLGLALDSSEKRHEVSQATLSRSKRLGPNHPESGTPGDALVVSAVSKHACYDDQFKK